jgi:hypothetical protein
LSPAAHVTGKAGALMRAPDQAARTRGDMVFPPVSPSVAAPNDAKSAP